MNVFLAIDLGAGSGRVMAGLYNGKSLTLEEVHRFANEGIDIQGRCYWRSQELFSQMLAGLKTAVKRYGSQITSVAVDSWGCDHALFDSQGHMLDGHRQYRDPRSAGMEEQLNKRMSLEDIYRNTGIQAAFYNSSLHLLAEKLAGNPCLSVAHRLLFTPDLFAYWLSGEMVNEQSITSTSQLYNPNTKDWAWDVIDALELPRAIFGRIVPSGTVLGPLSPAVAEEIGAKSPITVVASAGHDTASAVAGLPMEESGLWLSSGTWSIIGVESNEPVTTPQAFAAGLSNEGGIKGTTRLLHNVSGLWIVQECRRCWAEEGNDYGYAELASLAEEAEAFTAFIDPNDTSFTQPKHMPTAVQDFCRRTGQAVPETPGAILRVATDSLALKYRQTVEAIQSVTGKTYQKLHAGGGGIQNRLLIQSSANALGIPVVAGPAEATSSGNITTQMVATGILPDTQTGRRLIANSMQTETFEPQDIEAWDEAYKTFIGLV